MPKQKGKPNLFWNYALFAVVYFLQGALGLVAVAIPLFLKEVLGLSVSEVAYIGAITGIPWILKPIYGLVSDSYPIRNKRRLPWILLSASLASIGWLGTTASLSVVPFAIMQILAATGVAATDVFADGLAVQVSRRAGTWGFVQSLMWGSRAFGAVITGVVGGWLVQEVGHRSVFLLTAILPAIVFVIALKAKEKPVRKGEPFWPMLVKVVKTFFKTKDILAASAFLFVWFMAPSIGIPLFFHLRDTLQFNVLFLGILTSVLSVGGILGAVMYTKLFDRFTLKRFLTAMIFLNVASTLLVFGIVGKTSALAIYFVSGIIAFMSLIAGMKLVAKACPIGVEASIFAIVTGISNLSSNVFSRALGGWLYDLVGYVPLVWIAAGAGLLALPLVRWIRY